MLKFMVDASTGIASARYLQAQGYDVIFVGEWNPKAADIDIVRFALTEQRIIITNDKDFGEQVFRDQQQHGGVLLLRLADDRTITKLRVIQAVLAQYEGQLANTFVVATERHIRIRKPI